MRQEIAVIINGMAAPLGGGSALVKYFEKKGYRVISPDWLRYKNWWLEESFRQQVAKDIGRGKVKIIIGFSMGGMVVPWMAADYPEAKLIMIASGARMMTKSRVIKWIMRWGGMIGGSWVSGLKIMPERITQELWRKFNPPGTVGRKIKGRYERYIANNIRYLRSFKPQEIIKIIEVLRKIDNREKWRKIKNNTLIINGKKDVLIPLECGIELKGLMKKCCWMVTEGGHFDTIDTDDLRILEEFC